MPGGCSREPAPVVVCGTKCLAEVSPLEALGNVEAHDPRWPERQTAGMGPMNDDLSSPVRALSLSLFAGVTGGEGTGEGYCRESAAQNLSDKIPMRR